MPDITVDLAPFGTRAPGGLDRAVLAATRAMPDNWLGLRLAMVFRRVTMNRLGLGGLDTSLWGMRLRLYPRRNGCEKNALFTPQMFDVFERGVLADAIDRCLAADGTFTFVDIGANVGLYSLFVAARAGDRARILAIEPQPGILERLRFNLAANPAVKIEVLPVALSDRDGAAELVLDANDSGGTHLDKHNATRGADGRVVSVPCKTLAAVLAEAGITAVDALKIDVEGAEDLVLAPFLRDAPRHRLPDLILIEDTRGLWQTDVFALLERRGYTAFARSKQNVALRRAEMAE
jgi:FkbM family methyltransferase